MTVAITFTFLTLLALPVFAQKINKASDQRVYDCFDKFPIMLESIALTSNADWNDRAKSKARKKIITALYRKNPQEFKDCRDDIMKNTTQGLGVYDPSIVIPRMREVTTIIYDNGGGGSSGSTRANRANTSR